MDLSSQPQIQISNLGENQPEIRTTFDERKGIPSIIPSTEGVQHKSHSSTPTGTSSQFPKEQATESSQERILSPTNQPVKYY